MVNIIADHNPAGLTPARCLLYGWATVIICAAMKTFRKWGLILLLVITLLPQPAGRLSAAPAAAQQSYADQAAELLAQMDPRDRVGQLFLVTFVGDSADDNTFITDLILTHRIGGVVLLAANNNITDPADPPTQMAGLVNQLQTRALEASQQEKPVPEGAASPPQPSPFIPLLVAIDHEGDGHPFTRILKGVTQIPNNMAIGATWQPAYAEAVGSIVGQELSAMGINMLLGPSLDVLENPRPEIPGGMGTRSFGGDPYWVGLMGQAYTRGIHLGSGNRVAVVAKHFPGHGGSDRQPDQEVSTVRKSLEQLKQIELAPFFAVTGNAAGPADTTDALMTSHIRFQGFQGNIRESTRPISFDPQALTTIMQLPAFAGWRDAGGIMVTDALGVRAVKRFYDPQLREFPHRQIALDAFLAGNDLLLLSEFSLSGSYAEQVSNIRDTVEWFEGMYQTDIAFQARVDQAVTRILTLKLKLFGGDFSPENTLVPIGQIDEQLGKANNQMGLLAQDAITLLSPSPAELPDRLPSPPNKSENIVFFTDERLTRQCSGCPLQPLIGVNDLQNTILRLYGPNGTNQVLPGRLISFSFWELKTFLELAPEPETGPAPTPEAEASPTPNPGEAVQSALQIADWIIFAMLDVVPGQPQSDAVKTFLSERPDIANNAKIIVLAFNAPYYLDTTEISKLTAYYGVYSKIEPFIEASAKALFQQLNPAGASPVSIPGIGYDLIDVTSPSPDQIIQLFFDQPAEANGGTQQPLDLRVGDMLKVRTGTILDHNGNPVPDGTQVQFTVSYLSEGLGLDVPQPQVPTAGGIAQIDIPLNVPGQLQIKASSGDARASVGLAVTVFEDQPAIVEAITPLPTETPTPSPPTPTTTPSPAPPTRTPSATPTPTATSEPIIVPHIPYQTRINLGHLLVALLGVLLVGGVGYRAGWSAHREDAAMGLRLALLAAIGGLIGYNYFTLSLPGAEALEAWIGGWSAAVLSWAAAMLTVSVSALWLGRHRP